MLIKDINILLNADSEKRNKILSSLSPNESRVFKQVLSEISATGSSNTLEVLWNQDFKRKPVSIDQFLEDDYYLGKVGFSVFKIWRKELRTIFSSGEDIGEWIIRGTIGGGKSYVAVIALTYKIYNLLCLNDPQEYCGLASGTPIVFGLFNIYKYLAKATSYQYLVNFIKSSPFFIEEIKRSFDTTCNCPRCISRRKYSCANKKSNDDDFLKSGYIDLPNHITVALGSNAIHALGQNIFGGLPLAGDTEIPLLNGVSCRIDDLSHSEPFWVYGLDENKKVVPALAEAFYSGVMELWEVELDNGKKVRCADIHQWQMRDGTYKETKDLVPNDSLMPFYVRLNDKGYEEVYNPDGTWSKTHQLVAKDFYGDDIYKNPTVGEGPNVVHHINLDKRDNTPYNLRVMTFLEHSRLHLQYVDKMHSPESRCKYNLSMLKKYTDPEWVSKRKRISSDTLKNLWNKKRMGGYVGNLGRNIFNDLRRDNLRKRCIVRNKSVRMRELSGRRLSEWNKLNFYSLVIRSRGHMRNLWKSSQFREIISNKAKINIIKYNKSRRLDISFDDIVDATIKVININFDYPLVKSVGYRIVSINLIREYLGCSASVIHKRLRENNLTWNMFISTFGCRYKREDRVNNYLNHKIVSVRRTGLYSHVYCLRVPRTRNYAISAGVFHHNCDEVDLGKNKSVSDDEKSQMADMYGQVRARMDSRFIQEGGYNPGLLLLVSQVRGKDSFLEQHIKKVSSSPNTHISSYSLWDIKDTVFSGQEKFKVVVGDQRVRSFIPKSDAEIKPHYQVITVPVSLRPRFEYDTDSAIRDLAGIATYGSDLFLPRRDKLFECYEKSIPRSHPFTKDEIELSIDDDISIIDYFDKSACMLQMDKVNMNWRPKWFPGSDRAVHVDLAVSRDCAGLSMGCLGEIREVERFDKDENPYRDKDYSIFIDFALRIRAAKGSEIDFGKIRQFIVYLNSIGYKIKWISYDGFQSVESLQNMKKSGYEAKTLSVDKKAIPYNYLKSTIYECRFDFYEYEPFTEEVTKLQDRTVAQIKPFINHPPKGSKDVSDSICGVVTRLTEERFYVKKAPTDKDIEKKLSIVKTDKLPVEEAFDDPLWLVPEGTKSVNSLESLFDETN